MAIYNGTAGKDNIVGSGSADHLYGYKDADVLNGAGGNDTLVGGSGSDTYVVDSVNDVTIEKYGEGIDVVRSISKVYKIGSYVENLVFAGSGSFTGTGNHLDNTITGGSGGDVLYGGAGNDTLNGGGGADQLYGGLGADRMVGGLGNDTYFDGSGDSIVEAVGGGADTVRTTRGSYTLATNLEHLTFVGSGIFIGTGNAVNNTIVGGAGADKLDGRLGADRLTGNNGDDTYVVDNAGDVVTEAGGGGVDRIETTLASFTLVPYVEELTFTGTGDFVGIGNGAANRLAGGDGNDRLDGRTGGDRMLAGVGDDTYVVDNLSDSTIEDADAGTDTVETTLASWTLWANIENMEYVGTGNFNGTGNGLANTLTGGAGNDRLDGAAGADTMAGGLGNDTYIVDSATDVIIEAASAGIDAIRTALAELTLADNVENLTYTGGDVFIGTGNDLDNKLTGGDGGDLLDGGAGADQLIGGLGNDTYVVDDADDIAGELAGQGVDRVTTSLADYTLGDFVEELMLTDVVDSVGIGNTFDNFIAATSDAGTIATLIGGEGSDTLDGTLALGMVEFALELGMAISSGADSIIGFSRTGGADDDKLLVDATDFNSLQSIVVVNHATDNAAEAFDGDIAQFIYQQDAMMLWFDADGVGSEAAVLVATFDLGDFGNALTAEDFDLVDQLLVGNSSLAGNQSAGGWLVPV